jgi:hypothetical protein
LMDFKNEFENKVGMYIPELEAEVFQKWHWWSLSVHSEQLTRATTLPWYGTGLSPKFVYFSTGVS